MTQGKALLSISTVERWLVCGDLNGHEGADVDRFKGVHGGFGFGSRNVKKRSYWSFVIQ